MTTLALAVDADDELWTLDNLPTPEAPYVTVGDELIEVRARFPSQIYSLTGQALPPKIRVRRGIAGTTKASHIQGSTLTPNYGLGGGAGAGGVTVDNQSDPPFDASTFIAPGATESAPGEATLAVPVLRWVTTLTNAQVKALPTTGITVVPAPGAGKCIVPLFVHLRCLTDVDYTNIDANCLLQISNGNPAGFIHEDVAGNVTALLAPGVEDIATNAFISHNQKIQTLSDGLDGLSGIYDSDIDNVALRIEAVNQAAGNFTGGHADGTLTVTTYYVVADL